MAEELDLIGEVLKSNSIRRDNTLYDYSLVNGQLQIIKEPGVMDAVSDVAGVIGDVVGQGIEKVGDVAQATFEGTKGVAKGVPIGLSNFAKEFNKTFLPGYEENVVPFLQENIPGLKSLNNFVNDIFEYKNKAQEIGGEFIGEPIGEFGVTGGAISGVAKSAGIGNRFLANVLGYGPAEVIAVPADEQGLLSMGIEYLSPDSLVTTAILESLKSDEDQSTFIQKLQKAPENFFVGGVVGEQLDKAVQGVGTLYKYIKNSPKLESIKQELKGGISTLGDTAREFLDKNRGGTTLGSTDIPRIVAEGTKALDEMVNKPQGPELIGSTDVVVGDVVTFKQDVFGGSLRNPKRIGERLIKGEVVKESYGKDKQQHTFTIRPIEVFGDNASEIMSKKTFRIKGRNLYRYGVDREKWADENARKIVADEKHQRGDKARLERNIRKEGSPSQTIQQNQEILKPIGQKVTHPKFGDGEVISHDKAEGSSIINVKFNDGKIIPIHNNYVNVQAKTGATMEGDDG